MRVAFYTLGCKVNHYETAAMAELFTAAGHQVVDFSEKADAYVVNTCTVTAVADQKSRQMLSRAHAQSPDTLIVAVGCYSEVAKEKVASLPGVDLVLGTGGRKDIVPLVEQALLGEKPDPAAVPPFSRRQFEDLSAVADSRTRATLKVQDGCVSFCTYCAIPFARGALRSRSMESCRRELTTLTEKGYREIVLTGIELTEYGKDLADRPTLNDLIRLSDECGVERLRLGSLDPRFADEAFAQTCAQSRSLCHQFHLSLQSGSDTVLARMNRRYTAAEYLRNADRLRAYMPDAAITTDVMWALPASTCSPIRDGPAPRRRPCPASSPGRRRRNGHGSSSPWGTSWRNRLSTARSAPCSRSSWRRTARAIREITSGCAARDRRESWSPCASWDERIPLRKENRYELFIL